MSYDIWIEVPACSACGRAAHGVLDHWNYTSNGGRMWREAGADLAEFHGRPAAECAPVLRSAIEAMRAEPDRFRALEPDNRWGTLDTLLPALDELLAAMESAPSGIVQVSR